MTGCVPKNYTEGLSTRGFPDDIIPIEKHLIAYEYDEDSRKDTYTLRAGSEDDMDDIIGYYQDYFEETGIVLAEEDEGRKDYYAAGSYDGYDFELTIEKPSGKYEEKLYTCVVEIIVEANDSDSDPVNPDNPDNPVNPDVTGDETAKFKVTLDQASVIDDPTQYVDNEGGIVTLGGSSSLAGTTVTIPVASIENGINITVGSVEGTLENAPDTMSKTFLHLDVGEYRGFSKPMEITIKYANTPEEAEKNPMPVYVDDNGDFHAMTIKHIDKQAGTVTFISYHASYFTYYTLDPIDSYPDSGDTFFRPSKDGFKEVNQGSTAFRGGECYGMSSFAKWYFLNIKDSFTGDGFYSKYTDIEMGVSADDPSDIITQQDLIATMAFQYTKNESTALNLTENQHSSLMALDADGNPEYYVANDVAANNIVDGLFWGTPVEVGIYGPSTKPGGHSVLAYKYEKVGTKYRIYIYDPNYPGDDNQYIDFDPATKDFALSGYADGTLDYRLTTTGMGTFTIVDEYQKILDQANANFANTVVNLQITSHVYGEEVAEGKTYLTGTLDTYNQFGEQIGQYVEITNEDGDVFKTELTGDGVNPMNFSLEIPLKHGENYFYVTVFYVDQYGYHNQLTTDMYDWFLINSTVASNIIYVTLTWDYQPDVDLYVTDPAGETAWYSSQYTSSGGYLDIDDTSSYGPEHYTLTTENTVYYDQGYVISLHYYSGEGPTSYSVTVSVNEGTPYEYTQTFTGYISESDDFNDSPGSSGSDWAYITTVYPVDTSGVQ